MENMLPFYFFLFWQHINFQFIFGIKRKSDQDKDPIELNIHTSKDILYSQALTTWNRSYFRLLNAVLIVPDIGMLQLFWTPVCPFHQNASAKLEMWLECGWCVEQLQKHIGGKEVDVQKFLAKIRLKKRDRFDSRLVVGFLWQICWMQKLEEWQECALGEQS